MATRAMFKVFGRVLLRANNRLSHRLLTTKTTQKVTSKLFTRLTKESLQQKAQNPIAKRMYLPGSHGQGFPKYLANARDDLPYAVQAEAADQLCIMELGQKARAELNEYLPKYGVVLFRGLPVDNNSAFSEFCDGLGYAPMSYKSGTGNRRKVQGLDRVFTSTEDPKEFNIELHNEMACSTIYPRKVIFYCHQAPGDACGGLTPLARNSEVFSKLDMRIIAKLQQRQIRYHRYLTDESAGLYASWQQSFQTDDPREVDKFLDAAGFHYEWNQSDNSLTYWYILPPIIPHPVSGEPKWFTQPHVHHNTYYKESPMFEGSTLPNNKYPTHATYGDGEEFEPEVIQHIRAIGWQCAVGFPWQNGDVMVIDNFLAMHSRLSFTGERKIYAFLTAD
ncbi:predicted protein [Nematostella vectensis]|uniref:TauD/TfdA-like domain-containing protein n=2 Tax=Nematostella vectensis TaxID=45351 RepID=A7S555_NEMVE|nr:predicted protein [Nematostella vectensis]|eukprot:XP_001633247.1 predicted protein [Nematostella vectensis]